MFLNLCNHISWWTFGLIPVLSFVSKVAVGISYTRLRHTLALTFQISEVNILIQSTDIFLSFRKKIIAPCGLCVCSTFVSRIVVVQALSCAILCDPRGLQCASLPVLHHLLGFAQGERWLLINCIMSYSFFSEKRFYISKILRRTCAFSALFYFCIILNIVSPFLI